MMVTFHRIRRCGVGCQLGEQRLDRRVQLRRRLHPGDRIEPAPQVPHPLGIDPRRQSRRPPLPFQLLQSVITLHTARLVTDSTTPRLHRRRHGEGAQSIAPVASNVLDRSSVFAAAPRPVRIEDAIADSGNDTDSTRRPVTSFSSLLVELVDLILGHLGALLHLVGVGAGLVAGGVGGFVDALLDLRLVAGNLRLDRIHQSHV